MINSFKTMSFAEQMGQVAAELHRALGWNNDQTLQQQSLKRALELVDDLMLNLKTREQKNELLQFRNTIEDLIANRSTYCTLQQLLDYAMPFALVARAGK